MEFSGTTHCSLACTHEDSGVAQDGGYTTANRLMETCDLGLKHPSMLLDIHAIVVKKL